MDASLSTIILAAGRGSRMKSDLPKVLHQILGIPMIELVTEKVSQVGSDDLTLVLGHGADQVQRALGETSIRSAIQDPQRGTADAVLAAVQVDRLRPMLGAMHRGARWILAMQSKDGGWGAFDRDNVRKLFTQVPFADHNAMIDPSTADLTARMLEMFSYLNVPADHPVVRRAIDFVWKDQDPEHCWYGRWGVNYLYGTWQCLVGLTRIGMPLTDARIRKAANWLKSVQRDSGGWGETPRSYDDPTLKGQGPPTASQTAWAILGLIAAGEGESESVAQGIEYLLDSQNNDGTWDEEWWTGTGFPKVFYLKYHLYRISFPLMALSRYARLRSRA